MKAALTGTTSVRILIPALISVAVIAVALVHQSGRPRETVAAGHASSRIASDPRTPCSAVSAAVVARFLERPVTLAEAKRAIESDPLGRSSMAELIDGLSALGFAAVGVRLNAAAAGASRLPIILRVDNSHFVAALPCGGDSVLVARDEAELAAVMRSVGLRESEQAALVTTLEGR